DAAIMVFAGLLNKRLAAAISAEGQPAVGISAADSRCFLAEPMVHNEVEGGLGYVGYLTGLNLPFIESLWREGLLPVAPCLGIGSDNELYNINADHMAAACAEFLNADQLIYLTDVAGVLSGEKVLSAVDCQEIDRLVQRHVFYGGMMSRTPKKAPKSPSGQEGKQFAAAASRPDPRLLDAEKFLLPTYKRQPVVMSHGRGAYVFDSQGKKYLDFLGGIAVNALGHAHPRVVKVI